MSLALILLLLLATGDESPSAFKWRTDKNVKFAIEKKEIRQGIRGDDPRDGIPAIRKPKYHTAEQAAKWLTGKDRVLGVVVGKEARGYPLRVLERHEFVNDTLGGIPIGPNY